MEIGCEVYNYLIRILPGRKTWFWNPWWPTLKKARCKTAMLKGTTLWRMQWLSVRKCMRRYNPNELRWPPVVVSFAEGECCGRLAHEICESDAVGIIRVYLLSVLISGFSSRSGPFQWLRWDGMERPPSMASRMPPESIDIVGHSSSLAQFC